MDAVHSIKGYVRCPDYEYDIDDICFKAITKNKYRKLIGMINGCGTICSNKVINYTHKKEGEVDLSNKFAFKINKLKSNNLREIVDNLNNFIRELKEDLTLDYYNKLVK